jgi:hypothetical protein
MPGRCAALSGRKMGPYLFPQALFAAANWKLHWPFGTNTITRSHAPLGNEKNV